MGNPPTPTQGDRPTPARGRAAGMTEASSDLTMVRFSLYFLFPVFRCRGRGRGSKKEVKGSREARDPWGGGERERKRWRRWERPRLELAGRGRSAGTGSAGALRLPRLLSRSRASAGCGETGCADRRCRRRVSSPAHRPLIPHRCRPLAFCVGSADLLGAPEEAAGDPRTRPGLGRSR